MANEDLHNRVNEPSKKGNLKKIVGWTVAGLTTVSIGGILLTYHAIKQFDREVEIWEQIFYQTTKNFVEAEKKILYEPEKAGVKIRVDFSKDTEKPDYKKD